MSRFVYAGYASPGYETRRATDYDNTQSSGIVRRLLGLVYLVTIIFVIAIIAALLLFFVVAASQPEIISTYRERVDSALEQHFGVRGENLRSKAQLAFLGGTTTEASTGLSSQVAARSSEANAWILDTQEVKQQPPMVGFVAGKLSLLITDSLMAQKTASILVSASQAAEIDPLLVTAIVIAENIGRTSGGSRLNNNNLFRLNHDRVAEVIQTSESFAAGVESSGEPAHNILLGVRHLSLLQKTFEGSTPFTVLAHRLGDNAVLAISANRQPFPPEAQKFTARVLALRQIWQQEFDLRQRGE